MAAKHNRKVGLWLGVVVVLMVGLAFAAVPLYRIFCQVTGFGGTTQVATQAPDQVAAREITILFDASTSPGLPWDFYPTQRSVKIKVGEPALIYYQAKNLSAAASTGTATFNVTPLKAGQYFNKVQCFCFTEQSLQPGEEASLGVSFFIDPAILTDRNLDEVNSITLSYTFFVDPDAPTAPQPAAGAMR